ncbi:MarR family transcriptional regulator [Mycobacterium kansasii]|uniref:MarR family winged helix-turn-helix transcriptional regulator n=1 Tax=Mycobacterium kansasii TaxID=1768 RepID=UPI000CDE456F|nr:MarR family transcriptional regulator [Mycobacterium kansasii]POY02571.1 MarR family transcriptional regulator [Mycobacterium kansasii]POY28309.1 MarR family transcriptional regulator [Mycobacterium kansasii]POY32463.1 MarR family transcriptional regulator [Mycobacterium kansasii]
MAESRLGITALDQRVAFLLSQLGSYSDAEFHRRLAPTGVEPRSYAVLLALASDDGQSQRQLSARLGIHRNVMVTVIDDLERRRLVKRLRHPDDRRAFAVTLTDKGRRLLPTLDESGRELDEEMSAALSANERDTLRKLLQRMAAGAGLIPGVHPRMSDRG